MKKFVLFAAVFAVCAFALAACGGKKAEETPGTAEVVEEEVVEVSQDTTTATPAAEPTSSVEESM
jgi:ABC-type glycerol-3-phosphate transport system substrate-binding protein